ncbi:hypothetical protein SKAU_G00181270 [Synaphobranchus kaupii]|uniref:THUMP domain-containing protein 2 n=1 Tax=Synaphobranchus kaupii TaxID=118154 RepID=A0A9Q1FMT9_SYNKA|nr:hypothetical protein SKAU_G00181270 [Synaphobranchus kaupii]
MKDSSCLSRPLQYYCTAGKGERHLCPKQGKRKMLYGIRSLGSSGSGLKGSPCGRGLRKALERTEPVPKGPGRSRKRKLEQGEGGWRKACLWETGEGTLEEGGVSETRPAPVSFRVWLRASSSVSRMFRFQDLGRIIGVAISKHLGWSVNLREPELELNVHLSDDHCVLGLPLLRLPLASRSYIRTTGLRSTVAWAMASLAEIKPGSCVLDPMCGVGAILLEAAKECPNSLFLGMDIDESQLEKARDNVQFAELTERVEVIKSSVMAIPVPPCSVDAVICDIPFGRKFGSKTDMAARLPTIVKEMERVLRVGGALVLLLSPALASDLKRICHPQPAVPVSRPGEPPQQRTGDPPSLLVPSLELQSTHRVSLGTADALIHKYSKGGGVA